MINTLQSLRGVFAIMVFLSHFVINSDGGRVFYDGGPMGVEYFIVLSGFVLCAGYELRLERSKIDYRNFIKRRLIRIYPLHLMCLLLWAVVSFKHTEYLAEEMIPNLLLVQAWIPVPAIFYGCNTPSWCLSALLFCYLMFPFLIRLYERYPKAFLFAWGFCVLAYIYVLADVLHGTRVWTTRVFPVVRLLDFIFGMLLWQFFSAVRGSRVVSRVRAMSFTAKSLIELIPVAVYVVASLVAMHLPFNWVSQVVWWLPTLVCIFVFSALDNAGGVVSRLFDSRPLVMFGNASFCFYLLHMPIVGGLRRGLIFMGINLDTWPLFVATLVTAISVSLLVSRYVDAPVGRWLRDRL